MITFTKIPNWFFELLPDLKEADIRVLLAIFRYTAGYQKEETTLSYELLSQITGMSREGVRMALKRLKEADLIDQNVERMQAQKLRVVAPQIVGIGSEPALSTNEVGAKTNEVGAKTNEVGAGANQAGPFKENLKDNSKDNIKQNSDVVELLLEYGFNYDTAFYLEGILVAHGRDITHIRGVMGYVARAAKSNPHGLLIKMIEQNSDVPKKASQNGSQRLIEPAKGNMSAERLAELARITKGA